MFTDKRKRLFAEAPQGGVAKAVLSGTSTNPFISAGLKQAALTRSGNYAVKYDTTGNSFVDQFSNLGTYREPRSFNDIERDCVVLYSQDPLMAVKFILYLRTISRRVQTFDGSRTEKVQRGGGLKHEAIMRMIWLHVNHPDVFWANIGLFIAVGSWKDIFQMLTIDLEFNAWEGRMLDWNKFSDLFRIASTSEIHTNLFRKYMPHIQAKSACKTVRSQARTMIGKWLSDVLGLSVGDKNAKSYKKYRRFKTEGTAHSWQQAISRHDFSALDFNSIHGRALAQLVSGKFMENQGLAEQYEAWISSQPVAKYTGFVHELAMNIGAPDMCGRRGRNRKDIKPYQKHTINKQYEGLVELAKSDTNVKSGLIVVRDTSSSMTSTIPGQKISAYDVAKALGIFFGDMLEGQFSGSWVEFASTYKMHQYHATNFVDKWLGDSSEAYGSTNLLAVADLLATIKGNGVAEADFPTGMICISDGEFDRSRHGMDTTNLVAFQRVLEMAGFSRDYVNNFQFIFWDIRNSYYGDKRASFETHGSTDNVFYLSGYDGSILSFLLGGATSGGSQSTPKNAEELFAAAMDQEVLNMVALEPSNTPS